MKKGIHLMKKAKEEEKNEINEWNLLLNVGVLNRGNKWSHTRAKKVSHNSN